MRGYQLSPLVFVLVAAFGFSLPVDSMAAEAFPFKGSWLLINHRCVAKDGSGLPLKRGLHEKNMILTFEDQTVREKWDLQNCAMSSLAVYKVVGTQPVRLRMRNIETIKCDGFYTDRGVERNEFSYRREGQYLIEDHGTCADGAGVWQWQYVPLTDHVS